jgi:hypothetical protein
VRVVHTVAVWVERVETWGPANQLRPRPARGAFAARLPSLFEGFWRAVPPEVVRVVASRTRRALGPVALGLAAGGLGALVQGRIQRALPGLRRPRALPLPPRALPPHTGLDPLREQGLGADAEGGGPSLP